MSTNQSAEGRGKVIAVWVLTALLAIVFFAAGGTKLAAHAPHPANFAHWGLPVWAMYGVGAWEVLGAIALLVPRTTALGALWLIANMVGAVITRFHSAEYREALPPVVLGVLLAIVMVARKDSLVFLKARRAESAAS
jgi:uncharacterized membrane protein YphA (DoxX/SURF4 family)